MHAFAKMTEQVKHHLNFPTFHELKSSIKSKSKELIPGVSDPKIYQVTAGQRVHSANLWVFEGNSKLNYNCSVQKSKIYKSTFVLKCTHSKAKSGQDKCQGKYLVLANFNIYSCIFL